MLPAVPVSVGALAAADFDRNGRPICHRGAFSGRYPAAPRNLLLANRSARISPRTAPRLAEVGMVAPPRWSDDSDGWIDLLVAPRRRSVSRRAAVSRT
jgi:hypothetical protein